MPRIYCLNSETPQLISSTTLEPGSYHIPSLKLEDDEDLQTRDAIEVGIRELRILRAGDERIMYTRSLKSCFPVVFIYGNGDVALYHANDSNLDLLIGLLTKPKLQEIHVFSKNSKNGNLLKVQGFVVELFRYIDSFMRIRTGDDYPTIKINAPRKGPLYNKAVCFFNPEGQLVTLL